MVGLFLRLLGKVGLATLIVMAMTLPLTGLAYADDPLVINSTGDDGDANLGDGACETSTANECTLRAAIEQSNVDTTITHTISFSLSGSGPHIITPTTAFSDITHPVIIDGLTQSGASCTSPQIEIDGTNVEDQSPAIPTSPSDIIPPLGLNLTAGSSTVRGLSIYNFDDTVTVFSVPIDKVGVGISINTSDNNTIACNFLGVKADGVTTAPNQVGISIGNGSSNVITGNLISGNGNGGSQTAGLIIAVEPENGGESDGNQMLNNRIGTDVTGTMDLGNQQDGVLLVNAKNTVISGNLISGNGDDGIDVTDVAQITFQSFNFSVACDTAPCATGNVIQHNTIGLDIDGGALGNGNSGIEIKNAEYNRIYSNTVVYNGFQGVEVNELTEVEDICTRGTRPCTISNTISVNSIYSNSNLGINLIADSMGGVTPNGSGPSGSNMLQNYPVLSSVLTSTSQLYVSGVLTSQANSSFTVELFANNSCDPSGYGEGRTFLISDTVTTNGSGAGNFLIKTARPGGTQISATATDSGGNTSEFSECATVSGPLNTLFVDADATGAATGLSWTNAFTNPHAALAIADSGQEIWVAEGVYYPDEGAEQIGDSVTATFELVDGVALYGGFAATETERTDRDWEANVTILSGDIDQDDNTDSDNSWHVITANALTSAILDGFTVTRGNGGGGNSSDDGGGLLINSSVMTLTNLLLTLNNADRGGGGYFDGGQLNLENVTFSQNGATEAAGLFVTGGAHTTINRGYFTGNSDSGLENFGVVTLTNVVLSGNSAGSAAAIVNRGSGEIRMFNSSISGNRSSGAGAGIRQSSNNTVTVRNSVFWNNQDSDGVGSATSAIDGAGPGEVNIFYSLIEGNTPAGSGNLDGTNPANNPRFATEVDPTTAPTTSGDLRLLPGSPAIDSGDNINAPAEDNNGVTRPVNGTVDMGAYESQGFALTVGGGSNQSTTVNSSFTQPLTLTVSSSFGEPVGPGGVISVTAPLAGAGLATPTLTATTSAGGVVSISVTANSVAGSYQVTATARGGSSPVTFALTNTAALPSLSITKTVAISGTVAVPGDPITYTIVVANSGDGDASGVIITDTLPSGLNGLDLDETRTVTAGKSITLTLSAVISDAAANYDATITNTAYLSHTSGKLSATAIFTTADVSEQRVYLPVVVKDD